MLSNQAIKLISPGEPNNKVIHFSKQRNSPDINHQLGSSHQSTHLTTLIDHQAAAIVHDMRNPLCVILNVLATYQKKPLSQMEKIHLNLALEETERLRRMTDEILSHSYTHREPVILEQEIRLLDLIHEVIQLSKNSTPTTDCQIYLTDNSLEGMVKGDRDKLKQIFLNLLMNACEAVEPGGVIQIHIQLHAHAHQILVQIHNSGATIPPDLLPLLGHQPITTKSSGHGLGLMIVRKLIKAHAGTLEITSVEGEGTTVCVQLPIARSASSQPPTPASAGTALPTLSARELEILTLLVEGHTNLEIAQTLFISMNTVKTHVFHLINKFNVKGRTQVAVKALRLGLLK